ncbi:coiled-coil domain-containing protein 9 [Silurus asotus]|uniref:Coiled-coil domain-containing protein 9 n=1 Tax=Silurus asotus TaxID=30991 RepID=A0AAD5B2H1_SILAS|nr:coiled-coil domain-containing protein 9 [Silurus asotus]
MSTTVDLKSKEEKDAELDRRIEALRKKNEALMKRHQEIQEDKKKAEQEGIAVTTHRKPRAHEPDSERRKIEKENLTVTVDLSKPSGESRVVNDRQPAPHHGECETEEGFAGRHRTGSGRLSRGVQRGGVYRSERREPREEEGMGGGGGGGRENPFHSERSRGRRGGRGGRGSMQQQQQQLQQVGPGSDRKSKEWEEKRRQNIEKMNEEMEKIAEYERGQRADGEKNPIRNFLDDPRRSGPIHEADRKDGSRRHVRNWGGLDFENVKTGAEAEKEWTNRRPGGKCSVDMTLSMTGRERAEYLRWKKERAQIDEERLARHRNATGQWRREWDAQKTDTIMHDNRWEAEKEEEKGKKEEQENEKTKEGDKLKTPVEKKQIAVAVEKLADEEEDAEWEDASDGDDDEEEVVECEDKEAKPIGKKNISPPPSSPSIKEQRTPRPKVHIPSTPQESLSTPEGTKPISPFSPLDGHQPVSDWGEEMEMLSPKSSLGESPLRPSSNESSPAQNKSQEEEVHTNDDTNPPKQSDKQCIAEKTAVPDVDVDMKQSGSESAAPDESTNQPCSGAVLITDFETVAFCKNSLTSADI